MVAELEMKGTLTGTVETGASVDFDVSGIVSISPSGDADVSFSSPSISHQDPDMIEVTSCTERLQFGCTFVTLNPKS